MWPIACSWAETEAAPALPLQAKGPQPGQGKDILILLLFVHQNLHQMLSFIKLLFEYLYAMH